VLENQHGIPKGEEPVPLVNGFTIRPKDELASGQGTHQHHERRLGQVEVGDQAIDGPKGVSGVMKIDVLESSSQKTP
jgi:hypothetical protein